MMTAITVAAWGYFFEVEGTDGGPLVALVSGFTFLAALAQDVALLIYLIHHV